MNPGMGQSEFLDKFFILTKDYIEVGKRAMLEIEPIGVEKNQKDIRAKDRKVLLDLIEKRLPVGVQSYIVMDENPMCNEGWSYAGEPESYGIEKERCDIE